VLRLLKILRDIWILTDSGIVLFHRTYDKTLDEQLFGSLLSALNSFAEEISKEGLSNFEVQNKRFTLLKKNNIIFIANSSKKFKEKKVMEELKEIIEKFFKLYPPHLIDNWDNDIGFFKNFETEIEGSLEETIARLRNAFW
jgi:oligoribonuclease NrnB/cAMP/cGMP phosphodiesterase (DHH superfamily)